MSASSKNKQQSGNNKQQSGNNPGTTGMKQGGMKESNVILFGLVMVVCVVGFIGIVSSGCSLNADDAEIPADRLVRKVVRDQFVAVMEKDLDGFLACYSKEFFNGEVEYADKADAAGRLMEIDFEMLDFYIEFLPSGTDEMVVHVDAERGFASTFTYTYWKQRDADKITRRPVHKIGAFLLRKEGDKWRIISDRSLTLKQKEDAPHIINTAQFRPFIDPSTIPWPPARIVPKPVEQPEPGLIEQEGQDTGTETEPVEGDIEETGSE